MHFTSFYTIFDASIEDKLHLGNIKKNSFFFGISLDLHYLCSQKIYFKIMTQILVTLNEDATTLHVRKAIELLRGVVSTTVFKTKDESNKKTLRQQAYVKESLERAFDEMKQARREGRKLQSADDFIKELEAEETV